MSASQTPKGVTLPESSPPGYVLVRDCHLIGKCNCCVTVQRVLWEAGIPAVVYLPLDRSGQLLYLPEDRLEEILTAPGWEGLRMVFPFTALPVPAADSLCPACDGTGKSGGFDCPLCRIRKALGHP